MPYLVGNQEQTPKVTVSDYPQNIMPSPFERPLFEGVLLVVVSQKRDLDANLLGRHTCSIQKLLQCIMPNTHLYNTLPLIVLIPMAVL